MNAECEKEPSCMWLCKKLHVPQVFEAGFQRNSSAACTVALVHKYLT